MNQAQLTLAAFACGYGVPMPTPKPARNVCTACGEKIPPGKPGRRCKECRANELAIIDESTYPAAPFLSLAKLRDMGNTNAIFVSSMETIRPSARTES